MDATIIGAPSSTKNADKARDPEMHQTRKGQQWYFGMKLHIGWTAARGWCTAPWSPQPTCTTSTRCPICCTAPSGVYGDSAYASQKPLIESKAPQAMDFTNQRSRRAAIDEAVRAKNRTKSQVRARVEHVSAWSSGCGGSHKVRYRGLAKERHALVCGAGLANIFLARRTLYGQVRP